ncbi:MAG: pseudouridine-5'-phosphate glycosidase, partial [Deltaproteobacteria bacterium]
ADLPTLGDTPMVVVCAGAKSILDLPATLERLETYSVPVVGYQTEVFPAFYARSSGLPVPMRADSPREVVEIARTHWAMGMPSAVLVVVPPPAEVALPDDEMEQAVSRALQEAHAQGITGQAVTPFLLSRVGELTEGRSLRANLGLLLNNARVAAQIAAAFPDVGRKVV